jgi:hypothetical protein
MDFFLLPVVGRISKYLPEGFESTGVVVVVSLLNFAYTACGKLGSSQQHSFHVRSGYYERGMNLFLLDFAIMTGMIMIAPVFLIWN